MPLRCMFATWGISSCLDLTDRYTLHLGLQGREALFLDSRFVHARSVIIADFLFDGAVLTRRLGLLEDVAQDIQVVLVQLR